MSRFERTVKVLELVLLALTLAITFITGWYLYHQTSRHFALQRTSYMIERFNRDELVDARLTTDDWLETKECRDLKQCAKSLMHRAGVREGQQTKSEETNAENETPGKSSRPSIVQGVQPRNPKEIFRKVRLFCNFFQELGTAANHDTLDEKYMWDVFGYHVHYYGERLKPFIEELRKRYDRQGLYEESLQLIDKMNELDKKYQK